jgi:hypothetical protein
LVISYKPGKIQTATGWPNYTNRVLRYGRAFLVTFTLIGYQHVATNPNPLAPASEVRSMLGNYEPSSMLLLKRLRLNDVATASSSVTITGVDPHIQGVQRMPPFHL